MRQYYYIASSLPYLHYDSQPTLTVRELMTIFRDQLHGSDYLIVQQVFLTPPVEPVATSPVLQKWYAWEANVRNALAELRAKRKGTDAAPYLHREEKQIEPMQVAQAAFSQDSPLQAEEILNRARWAYLCELEVGHYFDIEMLILFTLKLLVLERKSSFDHDNGAQRYTTAIGHYSTMHALGENQHG